MEEVRVGPLAFEFDHHELGQSHALAQAPQLTHNSRRNIGIQKVGPTGTTQTQKKVFGKNPRVSLHTRLEFYTADILSQS